MVRLIDSRSVVGRSWGELSLLCPGCEHSLTPENEELHDQSGDGFLNCRECGRAYPIVQRIPDLRSESDRYLSLEAERAKARRLASIAASTDLCGLAEAYYAMTPDPDPARCRSFLSHILKAEARGRGLAGPITSMGRILELGCGTGGFLVAARNRGLDVTGVDLALRWLIVAQRRMLDTGHDVPLVAASAEALPWAAGAFETVVADSVIEHVDQPARLFAECYRILADGGELRFWSPNRYSLLPDPHVRLWGLGFLPRAVAQAYVRRRRGDVWLPRCLGPGEAKLLVEAAGFVEVEVHPPRIPPGALSGWRARTYEILSRFLGPLLTQVGPLWELTARKREQA